MALPKIKISEKISKEHFARFSKDESLTAFVNRIVENYIDDKIIELNPDNYLMIKKLSIQLNKPMEEMLNLCLSAVKFEARDLEKPVVELHETKIKPAVHYKKPNPFINY